MDHQIKDSATFGGVPDSRLFGRLIAKMHRASPTSSEARGGLFGFSVDTKLGDNLQPNNWNDDWPSFLRRRRIGHQLAMAGDADLDTHWVKTLNATDGLNKLFEGVKVKPATLHGELWSANIGSVAGWPLLVNPSSYFGHHEAEWGMSWCAGPFFGSEFWAGYDDLIPKANGWRERRLVYEIYHHLNQLNLFGANGSSTQHYEDTKQGWNAHQHTRRVMKLLVMSKFMNLTKRFSRPGYTIHRPVGREFNDVRANATANTPHVQTPRRPWDVQPTVIVHNASGAIQIGGQRLDDVDKLIDEATRGRRARQRARRRAAEAVPRRDTKRDDSAPIPEELLAQAAALCRRPDFPYGKKAVAAAAAGAAGTGGSGAMATRDPWDAWEERWHAALERWWVALPLTQQATLGDCFGALALHLGSRFEAARRAWLGLLGGKAADTAAVSPPPRLSREGEHSCEWTSGAALTLPEFPPLPQKPDGPSAFRAPLLPVPRLLPQRLLPLWQREFFIELSDARRRLWHLATLVTSGAAALVGGVLMFAAARQLSCAQRHRQRVQFRLRPMALRASTFHAK